MKPLRIALVVLLAFALLLALTATGVIAAPPADVDPSHAPYADIQAHMIPGNASQWHRFEYSGDNSVLTILMPNGADESMRFEVYTPEQLANWWKGDSIGVGSPKHGDLMWAGRFNSGGTYAVKVVNDNPHAVAYTLQFTGKAASFTQPITQPVTVVTLKALTTANMEPNDAAPAVSANLQVIPANSTLWYKFQYAGDHSQVLVTLTSGSENRLRMHIHSPEQMKTWWSGDLQAIGQGNVKGNDLIWSGSSHAAGFWFVEVVNDNSYAVGFNLTAEGSGVWE